MHRYWLQAAHGEQGNWGGKGYSWGCCHSAKITRRSGCEGSVAWYWKAEIPLDSFNKHFFLPTFGVYGKTSLMLCLSLWWWECENKDMDRMSKMAFIVGTGATDDPILSCWWQSGNFSFFMRCASAHVKLLSFFHWHAIYDVVLVFSR